MSKQSKNFPKHIAIILDGNRRWAKKNKLMPWKGHEAGAKKWQEVKNWLLELDIYELTLYIFSMQNLGRNKLEVFFLMKVFANVFRQLLEDPDIIKNQIRIRHIGRIMMLPKYLQKLIQQIEDKTKTFKSHIINIAMAYGGQEEIIDAVKKLFADKKTDINHLTPDKFNQYLDLQSPPDLIIRTSGEQRTSNFLCWQQAYSEWFFPKKYWPDFTKTDLMNIIKEYQTRDRRFGQ